MKRGLKGLSVFAFLLVPIISFAHDIAGDVVSKESHMMSHIMEAAFAISFAFCFFVAYLAFKDYQKKKTTEKTV